MKYGDKVKVTSGFYEGLEGNLKLEFTKFFTRKKEYVVEIKLKDGLLPTTLQFIPEKDLELID